MPPRDPECTVVMHASSREATQPQDRVDSKALTSPPASETADMPRRVQFLNQWGRQTGVCLCAMQATDVRDYAAGGTRRERGCHWTKALRFPRLDVGIARRSFRAFRRSACPKAASFSSNAGEGMSWRNAAVQDPWGPMPASTIPNVSVVRSFRNAKTSSDFRLGRGTCVL
jgi:hypothetical protein